ncbi:MAG TPA: hypothetical protein VGH85_00940 [Mycobacteriales bacterium]
MSGELSGVADPRALVPGDPDQLEVLAAGLGAFVLGMTEAAANLRAVGSGEWMGAAGDAFRAIADQQPGRYEDAGEAFGQAKLAVLRYADVLRDAQTTAARAVLRYQEAEQLSSAWQGRMGAYRAAETASERASSASHTRITVDVARPPPDDPGETHRAGAARLLADAHASVDIAARLTQTALADAERHAPTKPSIWHRFTHGIGEALHGAAHVAEGVGDGLLDMGKGLWSLTGAAVTDPHQFAASWQGMSTLTDVAHPYAMEQAWVGVGRSFVDADEWSKEPDKAFGHTLANVGALAAGGEGIAADTSEAAEAGLAGQSVTAEASAARLSATLRADHVAGKPWNLSPEDIPPATGWAHPHTLEEHLRKHKTDFVEISTEDDYIKAACAFHREAVQGLYSAVVDLQNVGPRLKFYDPATNRFLITETDSSIVTYYLPKAGSSYWLSQPGDPIRWWIRR